MSEETNTWRTMLGLPATGLDIPRVCRAFEHLARRIAPREFSGAPFNVAATSQLPADFAECSAYCDGWTIPICDLWLRPYVTWQGRGGALIINDVNIAKRWPPEVFRGSLAEFGQDELLAELGHVFLHELAHVVGHAVEGVLAEFIQLPPERVADAFRRQVASVAALTNRPPPNLHQHGAEFVRIACHVIHRARALGLAINPDACGIAGEMYGLSSANTYADTLRGEVESLAGESFAAILAAPAPHRFLWRFHLDREAYRC